jgi:F-type H+-transporting ATPase subunit alpha
METMNKTLASYQNLVRQPETALKLKTTEKFNCDENWDVENWLNEGSITRLADGIATVSGMKDVGYGELVQIYAKENYYVVKKYGIALDLDASSVGIALLDPPNGITEGAKVVRMNRLVSVPAGDWVKGRIVDALGLPMEGPTPETDCLGNERPIEYRAPSILERQPVTEPVFTGITTIDALIPVGCGQRELVIGDRRTGKTSIAVDAIIQQARLYRTEQASNTSVRSSLICVYAVVGQKASSLAATSSKLQKFDARVNAVILASCASTQPARKVIAPYAATALAEHFMYEGEAVLIIYDDLTRHAEAHREISLLLRRPPGREAYPGDLFYLHSRLLERSAKLSTEEGGGSITGLPIVETLEGDVSAYLPTNVISITDGQIFLSTERFNAGFLPAINIGISVSRVGSTCQTKLMKSTVGNTKLALAQFQELKAFSKFSSELDKGTRLKIKKGEILQEILQQDETSPVSPEEQIVLLFAANNGYLDDIPLENVSNFKEKLKSYMNAESTTSPATSDASKSTPATQLKRYFQEQFEGGVQLNAEWFKSVDDCLIQIINVVLSMGE